MAPSMATPSNALDRRQPGAFLGHCRQHSELSCAECGSSQQAEVQSIDLLYCPLHQVPLSHFIVTPSPRLLPLYVLTPPSFLHTLMTPPYR